jgi:Holliday junction resolvase YEN1
MEGLDPDAELDLWSTSLRMELRSNTSGFLKRKHPMVARDMPIDFPDENVIRMYTHPLTTPMPLVPGSELLSLKSRLLHIEKIAELCEVHFGWGIKSDVVPRLEPRVWPGAIVRVMLEVAKGLPEVHSSATAKPASPFLF